MAHPTDRRDAPASEADPDKPVPVEMVHCPYCAEKIQPAAKKCWKCHEFLSEDSGPIDPRAYELARTVVLESMKDELKTWGRRVVMTSAIGIVVLVIFSAFNFETMVQNRINEKVGPSLQTVQLQVAESGEVLKVIDEKLRKADSALEKLEELEEANRKTELLIEQSRVQAQSALRKRSTELSVLHDDLSGEVAKYASAGVSLDQLAAILGSANPTQEIADLQDLTVTPISPVSLDRDNPTVLFSNEALLNWQHSGPREDAHSYTLELGRDASFGEILWRKKGIYVESHRFKYSGASGRIYWRVRPYDANGEATAPWSEPAVFDLYKSALDRIARTGIVRIGMSSTYSGNFSRIDPKTNRLVGLDIELAGLIVAALPNGDRLTPRFSGFGWLNMLGKLRRNEVDLLVSTITIKPSREVQYNFRFSHPYFKTFQVAVHHKGDGLNSIGEIMGKRIVVQTGTSSVAVAEAFTSRGRIIEVAGTSDTFVALLNRDADVLILDESYAKQEIKDRKLSEELEFLRIQPSDLPKSFSGPRAETYGVAVGSKQVELLRSVNSTIRKLKQNGTLEEMRNNWHL